MADVDVVGTDSLRAALSEAGHAYHWNAGWMVEMEFSGRNNGWTDVTPDVRFGDGVRCDYGYKSADLTELVASSGTASLGLDNSAKNSGGLVGYYSPGHANCRSGFGIGIGVRISYWSTELGATRYYKWVGTADAIDPVANLYGELVTRVSAADWLDFAARATVPGLQVQLDKTGQELFSLLVAAMPVQPRNVSYETSRDVYPYAFDDTQSERRVALTELARICKSGLDRVFIKGDTSAGGGTLFFQSRETPARTYTNVDSFVETEIVSLQVKQDRGRIINRAQGVVQPRRVDAAATTVLYQTENRVLVPANTTTTLFAPYRDPAAEAERVGAVSVISPVAVTDWTANEAQDGTGGTVTGTVTGVDEGNGMRLTLVNTSSVDGWFAVQIRGKGVYFYRSTVLDRDDDISVALHGERAVTLDLPYQSSIPVADSIALYMVSLGKDARPAPTLELLAHDDSDGTLLVRALNREPRDRIGVTESVTGISTVSASLPQAVGYYIQGITITIRPRVTRFQWTLQPADLNNYWRVGVSGSSNVGSMMVAFGHILGHTDIDAVSLHSDVAHGDTAHVDTAHGDSAHLDHTDGAGTHEDTAHADSAHSDTAHVDTHSDTAHTDAAHADSHGDTAHDDTAHSDVAHGDTPHFDEHDDTAHVDTAHDDVAHDDTAHSDVAHEDVEHEDTDCPHGDHGDGEISDHDDGCMHADGGHEDQEEFHDDTAHEDVAHEDVAHADTHTDVAHGDTAHADDHDDGAHSDTGAHEDVAHVDVAHDDSHSDSAHGDVTHVDTHSDTAHVDTAHGDTAHLDHTDATHGDTAHADSAHADTAHDDVAHSDTHSDTPHGDEG